MLQFKVDLIAKYTHIGEEINKDHSLGWFSNSSQFSM